MNILETKNIFYWTIIIGTLFQIAMLPLVLWIKTSNIIVGTSLLICLVVCGTTLLLALLSVVTLLIYQKNKLEFEKNKIDKERSECEYLSKRDQEIANERYSINQQFSKKKGR
jgi:polyferredoxin